MEKEKRKKKNKRKKWDFFPKVPPRAFGAAPAGGNAACGGSVARSHAPSGAARLRCPDGLGRARARARSPAEGTPQAEICAFGACLQREKAGAVLHR